MNGYLPRAMGRAVNIDEWYPAAKMGQAINIDAWYV